MVFFKNGQTSVIVRVKLRDSSSSSGAGLTGLTSASAGLIVSTIADNEATTTRYRASSSEIETITTLGTFAAPTSGKCRFKEVDATNHPGLYEIQIADARWAVSSARSIILSVLGATNLVQVDLIVQLTSLDPYDAVRAGLTALPNAAAEASGGLPTLSAAQASNGTIQANVHRWLTGTPNALQSGRVDSYLGAVASAVIAAGSFAANALDAVWSTATRVLTAGTNIVLAKGTGLTGLNDLDAAGMRSAVGLASANLDTQLTAIDDYIDTEVAAIKAKTDNLPSDPADASDIASAFGAVNSTLATIAGYIDTEVAAIKAKTDNLPASPAATGDAMTLTPGERTAIADEVEAQIIDDTDSEKVLQAIVDKIAAANPSLDDLTLSAIASAVRTELMTELARIDASISSRSTYAGGDTSGTTTLLARLTATRAGLMDNLTNLDVAVSSRSTYAGADTAGTTTLLGRLTALRAAALDYLDAAISAVTAKTDNLPASPAATGDAMTLTSAYDAAKTAAQPSDVPTAVAIADEFLIRDWTAIVGSVPDRCTLNALRFLRNKWSIAGGTLSVKAEDDTTEAWAGAVSGTPTVDAIDPA